MKYDLGEPIWKTCEGKGYVFHKYKVNQYGEVKNVDTGKCLSLKPNDTGYVAVSLYITKHKSVRMSVHRLVGIAFIPNPENKPYINHIDHVRHNNRIDNLEWCTHNENVQDAVQFGSVRYGENSVSAKISNETARQICQLIQDGVYIDDIVKMLNTTRSIVKNILNKSGWVRISKNYDFSKYKELYGKHNWDGDRDEIVKMILENIPRYQVRQHLMTKYGVSETHAKSIICHIVDQFYKGHPNIEKIGFSKYSLLNEHIDEMLRNHQKHTYILKWMTSIQNIAPRPNIEVAKKIILRRYHILKDNNIDVKLDREKPYQEYVDLCVAMNFKPKFVVNYLVACYGCSIESARSYFKNRRKRHVYNKKDLINIFKQRIKSK